MLKSFCGWLEKTPLSVTIQDVSWIIPFSQVIHILCLAVVLSSVVFLDARLLGLGPRRVPVSALARRFLPPVWVAVALMALSGCVLIIGEPRRDLLNPVFQIKMLLLALALLTTLVVQARLAANRRGWGQDGAVAWPARLLALASLTLWLGVAVCGRFIAYFMG